VIVAANTLAAMTMPRGVDARAALALGVRLLEAASVPSAALSAELLLLHVVGRDRAWLYAYPECVLSASEQQAYERCLARRASGEPAQYITGRQEFWGLAFEVTPSVLIPRPETEHVIEVALARLGACGAMGQDFPDSHSGVARGVTDAVPRAVSPGTSGAKIAIADVGTGSGCIAVALAKELPLAQIIATDISAAAVEVAQRNIARHGVSDRVRLLQTDLLEGVCDAWPAASKNQEWSTNHNLAQRVFDLIVSNPPYVARNEARTLAVDVREHEPHTALFGGATGVEMYAPLIAQAGAALRPGGVLVLELGYDSADRVRAMFSPQGMSPGDAPAAAATFGCSQVRWDDLRIVNDLAGIPRVISAIRV
jgi:release factor glutamine methyltransferase